VESRHAVQYFHKHNVGARKYHLDLRERKVSLKLLSLVSGAVYSYISHRTIHIDHSST
jgi:hypothetical protein